MVLFCHKAHSKAAINPTTPPGLPHRRWLNGTAANQARPSCAASSMPRLDEGIEIDVASAGAAVHSVQSSRRSAVLPFALGTLLPLAAIAIGSRLWQRRRRRAEWQARQQDSETLLTLDLRTRQGSSGSSSDSDQRVEAQMPAARRQRLAALLSKRPGGTIEMLPLGEVQRYALLAHKVASSSSGEANTHYEPAHEADLEAGQPGRLPTAGGDRGGRPRPAWGLPTDSLRLKPSQLEVSCEALVCAAAGVSMCCQLAPIWCAAHLLHTQYMAFQVAVRWLAFHAYAACPAALRPLLFLSAPQFVADEEGQLVALGSGTQGDVFLARLDAVQVAVKVSCPCCGW